MYVRIANKKKEKLTRGLECSRMAHAQESNMGMGDAIGMLAWIPSRENLRARIIQTFLDT